MKKNIIAPRTLSGFMELLPQEQAVFNKIKSTLESVYSSFGFFPLDTPVLEYSEILLAKAGGETEKQLYRFSKGDTDLTMRFDLTVPLAKYVAKNAGNLSFPFKRYQIGKVYRGERTQRGRFREFYQSDIDIIGDGQLSIVNDAEIPAIIYNIFIKLGIDNFTVRINNRKVLNGFYDMLGFGEQSQNIMRIVDKIDKIGEQNVIEELGKIGVEMEKANKLIDFIRLDGSCEEVIKKLKALGDNEVYLQGVGELEQVTSLISAFGVPEKFFKIDLSIARGLDYYTGTVYETTLTAHPEIGSVCSGGRYDNLAEYYTERKLPGVGMSIGLTRLFYILNEKNYINKNDFGSPCDAMIIPMSNEENYSDTLAYAVKVGAYLRENGISTQIYYENKKFKGKISYADKLSIPNVVFIGEDEIKNNVITVKNLKTHEQQTIPQDKAVEFIVSNKKQAGSLVVMGEENA